MRMSAEPCRRLSAFAGGDHGLLGHRARGLRPEELSAKSKGRNAKIPGIWINSRLVRFHPRMTFAKVARDNGVPMEVIRGALNVRPLDEIPIPTAQRCPAQ